MVASHLYLRLGTFLFVCFFMWLCCEFVCVHMLYLHVLSLRMFICCIYVCCEFVYMHTYLHVL